MDLATMTAAPTTLAVGGRKFRIGPFRYLELGIIQRFLNERHAAGSGPAGARPPQVGDGPAWVDSLFGCHEGVSLFLGLLFGKHEDLDDEGLAHVLKHVGPEHMGLLFAVAMDLDIGAGAGADAGEGGSPGDGPKPGAAPSTS